MIASITSKRLEGIEIALTGNEYSGHIIYSTHVQSYGWMDEVKNGMMSGTSRQSKRLEAITIRLSGEIANHYDIYYRVHAQDYGWLGWAKNGECAGTSGQSKRLEAIQIVLMKKEAEATAYVHDIAARFPKVVCGYTDELSKMFRKTLPEFLNLKYYAAEQVQQAASYMPE